MLYIYHIYIYVIYILYIYIYIYTLCNLYKRVFTIDPLDIVCLVHIFLAIWQENEFNICVGKLFIYIPVTNHTPTFILNLFSCQKNANKAKGL